MLNLMACVRVNAGGLSHKPFSIVPAGFDTVSKYFKAINSHNILESLLPLK